MHPYKPIRIAAHTLGRRIFCAYAFNIFDIRLTLAYESFSAQNVAKKTGNFGRFLAKFLQLNFLATHSATRHDSGRLYSR